MTQEAIQITETPPLPGLKLVQDSNKALMTIATDFAGAADPAALAGSYMAWADTANGLLKRRNAANSAWESLGLLFGYKYSREDILGTVGMSLGVPSGAIFSYSGNANGTVLRLADGTQICMASPIANQATNVALGALYSTGALTTWTFPAAFVAPPAVSGNVHASNRWLGFAEPTTINVQVRQIGPFLDQDGRTCSLFAIGRWAA